MVKSTKRNNYKKKKGGRKTRQKGGYSPGSSRGSFDAINSFYTRNTAPPPIMHDLFVTARENINLRPTGDSNNPYNDIVDAANHTGMMPIARDPFSITTGETDHHRESAFEGAELPAYYKGTNALGRMITERALDDDQIAAAFDEMMKKRAGTEFEVKDIGFGDAAGVFGDPTKAGMDRDAFADDGQYIEGEGKRIESTESGLSDNVADLAAAFQDDFNPYEVDDQGKTTEVKDSEIISDATGLQGEQLDDLMDRLKSTLQDGPPPTAPDSGAPRIGTAADPDAQDYNVYRSASERYGTTNWQQGGGKKRKTRKHKRRKHKKSKRRRPRRKTKKH